MAKQATYEQAVIVARKYGFGRKFARALDASNIPEGLLVALLNAAVNNGAPDLEHKIACRMLNHRDIGETVSDGALKVLVLCEIIEAYKYNSVMIPSKWAHSHTVIASFI